MNHNILLNVPVPCSQMGNSVALFAPQPSSNERSSSMQRKPLFTRLDYHKKHTLSGDHKQHPPLPRLWHFLWIKNVISSPKLFLFGPSPPPSTFFMCSPLLSSEFCSTSTPAWFCISQTQSYAPSFLWTSSSSEFSTSVRNAFKNYFPKNGWHRKLFSSIKNSEHKPKSIGVRRI